ncbi:MAG: hydroxymethylglutaryl-CoA reductase, degradative [Anaerolineae bacterium]
MERTSRLSGFYQLPLSERVNLLAEWAGLSADERNLLSTGGLDVGLADRMVENVVGAYALPLGIATNFTINGRDYLIPMAVEEPSVVAGASYAAKLARVGGGFVTDSTPSEMIAQIQVLDVVDPWAARLTLLAARGELFARADSIDPVIQRLGGGSRDLEVEVIEHSAVGPMLEVRLVYDCLDAMGANTLNTIAEALAPAIAELCGGRVNLRIISNLADRRLARARCTIPATAFATEAFGGTEVVDRILEAQAFAACSPYRAATHNKGIMNGIDAVVVATGNDWRAIEAGAHAYAARSGRYTSLSHWERNGKGDLAGTLELPMALGLVGGATRVHPTARLAIKILGVESARELGEVIAAVGLSQNLAAIRALATEGIQRGHMRLHARQVALAAGAEGDEVSAVAEQMASEGAVHVERAEAILRALRQGSGAS